MFGKKLFLLVLAGMFLLPVVFGEDIFSWAEAQDSSFSARVDFGKLPFEVFTSELPKPVVGSIVDVAGVKRYSLPVSINNPISSESQQFAFVGESQFGVAAISSGLCFKFFGCGTRTVCGSFPECRGGTCCVDYQACALQGNRGFSSSVFLGEPNLVSDSCLGQSFVKPVSDSLDGLGAETFCLPRSMIDSKNVSGLTKFSVYQNQKVCQTSGDPDGITALKQVGLQVNVWVDSSYCMLPSGTLVVSEPFKSGALVSKDRLRYPSKAFCSKFPILKVKGLATEQRMDASLIEYDKILKGETLVVPEGEVWNLFYVIEANPTIDLVCEAGNVWNTEKKICEKFITGFVYVCPSGAILDESRGTCSVQGTEEIVCEKGFYSKEKNACIYNPPLNYNCPVGTPTVFGDGNVVCLEQAATVGVCPSPLTFSSVFNACAWKPPLLCNPYLKSVYNSQSLSCEFNSLDLVKCPIADSGQTFYDFVKQECNYPWLTTNVCPSDYSWKGNGFCSHVPTSEELCPAGWEFNFSLGACTHAPDFYQLCPTVDYIFEPASDSNDVSKGQCILQAPDVLFKQVISLPDKNVIFSFDYGKLVGTGQAAPDVTVIQLSDAPQVVDCRQTPSAWQCSNPNLEDILAGRLIGVSSSAAQNLLAKQKDWTQYLPYAFVGVAVVALAFLWFKK